MKNKILALAWLAAAGTTASVWADDSHHKQEAAMPDKQAAAPAQGNMNMPMQMEKMHAMHEKMMQAKTPEERQQLMSEHMKTMHEGMAMMKDMHKSMPMGDADKMMGMRMDMMEMMMQMMMDQQSMTMPKMGK